MKLKKDNLVPLLDSAIDSAICDPLDTSLASTIAPLSPLVTLPPGEIDPRLKQLSHSSRTLLHSCPRKYQLYRLKALDTGIEDLSTNVTFAYGTAVGVGIQATLEWDKSESDILIETFLAWDTDILEENKKQKKSLWEALFAVQKFIAMRKGGFLEDYELVYYSPEPGVLPEVPAIEFSFRIHLPNGFTYRGYLDGILRHKDTGEILVLECKTTAGTAQNATYKNSGQALGYSVVLDILFPELSSYEVLYLVYESRAREYKRLHYTKSLLQRALWLQELILDCKQIELYEEYVTYPMHGESCFSFFRECERFGLCTLSTANLVDPLREVDLEVIAAEKYMFEVDFYDLVESQITKGES